MAINYVKGELLTANLLRGGVDLAVETDLLYLDVNSGFIGVKNATPAVALDVTGDANVSNAITAVSATFSSFARAGDVIIDTSTIGTLTGDLKLTASSNLVEVLGDMKYSAASANLTGPSDSGGTGALAALTIASTTTDIPYYIGAINPPPGASFAAIAAANGFYMTADGLTVFYVDSSGGGTTPVDVYQTTLLTAFNMSTADAATFTTVTGGAETEAAHGITFNPNGLEMYISKYNTNVAVLETVVEKYTLSVAFDLSSTITYIGVGTLANEDLFNFAPAYSSDGLKAYNGAIGTLGRYIDEWDLSPAYDLTTAVFNGRFAATTEIVHVSNYITVAITVDGSQIFAAQDDGLNNQLVTYDLGTAHDITTAVVGPITAPAITADVRAMWFKADGFELYWLVNDGEMFQFDSKNVSPTTVSTALNYNSAEKLITTDTGVHITGVLDFEGANAQIIPPTFATASLPATPTAGGTVYDSDINGLKFYNGSAWEKISSTLATGSSLTSEYVLTATTTDETITEALRAGTDRLVLPNYGTWRFEVDVVSRRTDSDNESAGYKFTGVIDRQADPSTTAIVGAVAEVINAEDNAAWVVTVDADTTNGSLRIQVTGEAAKTIKWVAFVTTSEVAN